MPGRSIQVAGGVSSVGSSAVAGTTPVGGSLIVRRSANSTALQSDTTPNADDTLLWSVAANEVWHYEAWLLFTAASATMDCTVGFTLPASATMFYGAVGNGTNVLPGYTSVGTASGAAITTDFATGMSWGSTAGTYGIMFAGTAVISSTAGTATLTWSQSSSEAANLTLLANSYLLCTRVA